MKSSRIIIAAIAICIMAVVAIFIILKVRSLLFQPKPFLLDDNPEGVALNYQLALIREDYPRAYGYLSPSLEEYPSTIGLFVEQLEEHGLLPELGMNPCVYAEKVDTLADRSTVELREQFYDPCTGVETQNLSFGSIRVQLEFEEGAWRIIDADKHFVSCWTGEGECE